MLSFATWHQSMWVLPDKLRNEKHSKWENLTPAVWTPRWIVTFENIFRSVSWFSFGQVQTLLADPSYNPNMRQFLKWPQMSHPPSDTKYKLFIHPVNVIDCMERGKCIPHKVKWIQNAIATLIIWANANSYSVYLIVYCVNYWSVLSKFSIPFHSHPHSNTTTFVFINCLCAQITAIVNHNTVNPDQIGFTELLLMQFLVS